MLRKPHWVDLFPKKKADELAKRFAFRSDFDLSGRLSKDIHTLQTRIGQHETHGERIKAAKESIGRSRTNGKLESSLAAVVIALSPESPALALRKFDTTTRAVGLPEDWPRNSFYRALGAIYEDGTGRKPSTGGRNGSYRGKAYHFAKEVCEWINTQPNFSKVFSGSTMVKHLHYRRKLSENAKLLNQWLINYCTKLKKNIIPKRDVQRSVTPARLRRKAILDKALRNLNKSGCVLLIQDGRRMIIQIKTQTPQSVAQVVKNRLI